MTKHSWKKWMKIETNGHWLSMGSRVSPRNLLSLYTHLWACGNISLRHIHSRETTESKTSLAKQTSLEYLLRACAWHCSKHQGGIKIGLTLVPLSWRQMLLRVRAGGNANSDELCHRPLQRCFTSSHWPQWGRGVNVPLLASWHHL